MRIDYKTWHEKYKPMEEELSKLRRELEREKNSKSGTFFIRTIRRVYPFDSYGEKVELGTLDFSIEEAPKLSVENRELLVDNIEKIVWTHFKRHSGVIFKIASKEYLDKNLEAIKQYHKKIAEDRKRIDERLNNLGKFWKWLLKLN